MGTAELSQYCRDVEDHLTRVNGGHLVRIVGQGFELVRGWAEMGIPLSIVFRGIELKADRHRLGTARRPLRIEFCQADVLELYESWSRAVGLRRGEAADGDARRARPALPKHLDRVIDRLGRIAGATGLPQPLLETIGGLLEELAALRRSARGARGAEREQAVERLAALDERMLASARAAAGSTGIAELTAEAASELAAFRDRLAHAAWQQAIDVTVDRLLRARFHLPTLRAEQR